MYEPSFKEIALAHVHTRDVYAKVRVGRVFDRAVIVEWPLNGSYTIRKSKAGIWKSTPSSLFKYWKLTSEALSCMEKMILEEEQHRDIEQKKRRGTWSST